MPDFVALEIADVKPETADAIVVGFAVPQTQRDAFRFKPGQHMAVRTTLAGQELRRTYSICSEPHDPLLRIAVKRIAGGAFSNWANDTLAPGMMLELMPPAGRFVLPASPGPRGHVLAFAASIGITPIMAMIEQALSKQPGSRFTLVYGNRDLDSIIFRQRLEDLKDAHIGRLTLVHVLSRNDESDTPLLEGRISSEKVRAFAGHVFQVDDVDHAFLCGPGTMIRDVRAALFDLGMARECVHHEFFAAGGGAYRTATAGVSPLAGGAAHQLKHPGQGSDPVRSPPRTTDIVAVLDGVRHRFTAQPGEVLIEAALRAGVRAPYACKGGMCSTCRAKIVEGRVAMRHNYSLEPWELEKGFVLTCQAVAETDRIGIDYDQM